MVSHMARFSCPKCKTVVQVTPEEAGKTIACLKCKAQLKAPPAAPVATVAPQPAGPAPDWLSDVRAEPRADRARLLKLAPQLSPRLPPSLLARPPIG